MAVSHKFTNHDFNNGFQTHNAILDVTPYDPEVLIVGTFNPDTVPNANSDFYYSRNYFWPALNNLLGDGRPWLPRRRDDGGNLPSIEEIFNICHEFALSFGDLISGVLHANDPLYELQGNKVLYQDAWYDLINDGALGRLHALGQVNWTTNHILDYIAAHPTITTIYLTRVPVGIWLPAWSEINLSPLTAHAHKTNIYTPSGQA